MIYKIAALMVLLFSPATAVAWTQNPPLPVDQCRVQVPWGMPTVKTGMPVICRHAYVLEHDNTAKIPVWVAYTLTPEHAVGCIPRTNAFAADDSLADNERATPEDYAKSGFDIGHMASAANMAFDNQAMQESFLLSNMSPQLPGLNRGIWKVLESSERAWAWRTKHTFTIYAGNIYTVGRSKTIGKNAVIVPDYLYKIVIDNTTRQVQAFLFPHREGQGTDLAVVLTTIAEIERLSGTVFPVPPNVNKYAKPAAVWPADLKAVADAKKTQCK
jgi:endonuclease G